MITMRRQSFRVRTFVFLVISLFAAGCGEDTTTLTPSLEGPRAMEITRGEVCLPEDVIQTSFRSPADSCPEGQEQPLGLIVDGGDRLALADMTLETPQLIDLDSTVPGVTHLRVGDGPVDVTASPDGTVAYTANEIDQTISVADLWVAQTTSSPLAPPDGRPKDVAVRQTPGDEASNGGELVVALNDPNTLWVRPGVTCEPPEDAPSNLNTYVPDDDCSNLEVSEDATETLPLAGTTATIEFGPRGHQLFVVYNDRPFMSVIAFDDAALEDRECRGGRDEAPCEVARVGLTHACSDGVDNDGDGEADQDDPQCYSPLGAESPDGVGRSASGACSDGEDNDGDGDVDREDDDCLLAGGESEAEPTVEDPPAVACSDGVDNDDDGLADYPEDPGCYGEQGQSEASAPATGFDDVSLDPMGQFAYVVDRSKGEVLVVDATRLELIDAGRATDPPAAPFTDNLGISIGQFPTSVAADVSRSVVWREGEGGESTGRAVVRYNYGAYVASNNGWVYVVDTMSTYCDVAGEDVLVDNSEFDPTSEAFQNAPERHCVTVPDFPLEPAEADENGDEMEEAAVSAERRLQPEVDGADVHLRFNPRFELTDNNPRTGGIRGRGNCEEPDAFLQEMRNFTGGDLDYPDSFGCYSPLRSQPLANEPTDPQKESDLLDEIPRADLIQQTQLTLESPENAAEGADVAEVLVPRPLDSRFRNETWNVTWEGVLPGTRRDDGLVAPDGRGNFDVSGLNLCRTGVRAGDRLTIRSAPGLGGEVPEGCGNFENENPEFRTYRIEEVYPNSVQLAVIEEEDQMMEGDGETNEFVDELPSRSCFPRGVQYQIRPNDEWIVVGSQSGYVSDRTSRLGACVPRAGADSERMSSRVETGERFQGPYLDFTLYEGPVETFRAPNEPFQYSFRVNRGFSPLRYESEVTLPTEIILADDFPTGDLLFVLDASGNFVWVRNLSVRGDREFIIQ